MPMKKRYMIKDLAVTADYYDGTDMTGEPHKYCDLTFQATSEQNGVTLNLMNLPIGGVGTRRLTNGEMERIPTRILNLYEEPIRSALNIKLMMSNWLLGLQVP